MGVAFSDQPIEGSASFLHWGFVIGSVTEDDIDVVEVKVLKAFFHSFDDMFSGESSLVRDLVFDSPEDFGGEDEVMSWDFKLFESSSDLSFCFSES